MRFKFTGFIVASALIVVSTVSAFGGYSGDKKAFFTSQQKKISSQSTSSSSVEKVANENIEIGVHKNTGRFTIGTVAGNPNVETDDHKKLLFGHPSPGTSFTSFKIDGKETIFGDYSDEASMIEEAKNYNLSNISTWKHNRLEIKQILTIKQGINENFAGNVEVKYEVTNKDNVSHSVGARVMLDTMLGDNDGSPINAPGPGVMTYEKEFTGSDIPMFWQSFDRVDSPAIVAQGSLYGWDQTKPDKFMAVNWRNIVDTVWSYTPNTSKTISPDSAVAIYFDPIDIAAGYTKTFVTYYGLGDMTNPISGELYAASLTGTTNLDIVDNDYSPNPVKLGGYIENISSSTLTAVKAEIELPEGLSLATTDSKTRTIGDLNVAANKDFWWDVKVAPQMEAKIFTYKVNITVNGETKAYERELNVPSLHDVRDLVTFVNAQPRILSLNAPEKVMFITGKGFNRITQANLSSLKVSLNTGAVHVDATSIQILSDSKLKVTFNSNLFEENKLYSLKITHPTFDNKTFENWVKFVTRNITITNPNLSILSPIDGDSFDGNVISVIGKTDPDVTIILNDDTTHQVSVEANGDFFFDYEVPDANSFSVPIKITAKDAAGNTSEYNATVYKNLGQVTGVVISPDVVNVNVGNKATVSAFVKNANGQEIHVPGNFLTWKVESGTSATVNEGEVTGVRAGSSVISAKFVVSDNLSFTSNHVSVVVDNNPDIKYTITTTALEGGTASGGGTFNQGQIATLTAVANTNYEFEGWYENGVKIDALAIYPFTPNADRTLEARFTKLPVAVTGLTLNKDHAMITAGDELKLTATIEPLDATIQDITWSTNNAAVATVLDGNIKAIAQGTATITAVTVDGEKSASCIITVPGPTHVAVEGISFEPKRVQLEKRKTITLVPTFTPSNATNKKVVWVSSNTKIATVDNGVVYGVQKGTVSITAITEDGDFMASCFVNVYLASDVDVTGVELNRTSATMEEDSTLKLTATIAPQTATNRFLIWESSNENVATVSDTGIVSAFSKGTTTITVTADGGYEATCLITVIRPGEVVPTVTVLKPSGRPGDEVEVKVVIANNPGIAAFVFKLDYDTSKLIPLGVTRGKAVTGNVTSNISEHNGNAEYDNVTAQWSNASNLRKDGELFVVRFKIATDATPGEIPVELSYTTGDIANQNGDEVNVSLENGIVTVSPFLYGDVNSDNKVTSQDLIKLNQYLAGWNLTLTNSELRAADVFSDSVLNIKDAIRFSQYMANWNVKLGK